VLDVTTPWPPEPPVQASDPARLWNGQVMPRQVVEMPTGGSFTVDLARAPEAIRELEHARDQLVDLTADVVRLGKIEPGTMDEVSRDAAVIFGAVATGGQGSLLQAVRSGIDRLNNLIGALDAELAAYRAGEAGVARAVRDPRS
jgi:hypothetical protein